MRIYPVGLMSAFMVLVVIVPAAAREKKIARVDLPAAVEKTVAAQSQGAEIKGFSVEEEGGKTFYEAEMMVDGHGKDVLMSPDGAIVEVEEQVRLESLTPAVQAGLQGQAGAGKIVRVESLSKRGTLVAYEAVVTEGKKKSEVQVGPDGKPLDHEE